MTTLPISDVRSQLPELGNRVSMLGERVLVERHGKALFAMVSVRDLEVLELLEDKIDLDTVRARASEPSKSWAKVKKDLGL